MGTTGGLVRFSKSDGSTATFTKANCPLLSNYVSSLAIDTYGTVWAGSDGLTRFSGKRWTTYTTDNSILPSNNINSIATGTDGSVWISTNNGLVRYMDDTWSVFNTSNSDIPDNNIRVVLPLDDGTVWVNSGMTHLVKLQGNYRVDSLSVNLGSYIRPMFQDINGDMWFSSGDGLARYNGSIIEYFNKTNTPLPNNSINKLIRDTNGHLWIGTCCGGLVQFDSISWTIYNPLSQAIPSSCFTDLFIDINDRFWIGSKGAGLLEFDGVNWTRYKISNTLFTYRSINEINAIITDQTGTTWLGTYDGIYGFNGQTQTWLSLKDTAQSGHGSYYNEVYSLAVDPGNVLWAGTFNNLTRIENGSWTSYDMYKTWGVSGTIQSMAFDPSGNLWVLMYQNQLFKYDGTSFQILDAQNSGYTGGVGNFGRLNIDNNGVLWITDFGKLTKYDGSAWTTYDQTNSPLPLLTLYDAVTDTTGVLWIGSDDGLIRFDGLFWDFYNAGNSNFPLINVLNLKVDKHNNLWASGFTNNYSGAVMFDGYHTVAHYDYTNSPLPNNEVVNINIDHANNKWFVMGNYAGITVYNESGVLLSESTKAIKQSVGTNLWPNPFSDIINIETQNRMPGGYYTITDMQGRLLMNGKITEQRASIGMHHLSQGVYIFSMTGDSGSFSRKIIKTY